MTSRRLVHLLSLSGLRKVIQMFWFLGRSTVDSDVISISCQSQKSLALVLNKVEQWTSSDLQAINQELWHNVASWSQIFSYPPEFLVNPCTIVIEILSSQLSFCARRSKDADNRRNYFFELFFVRHPWKIYFEAQPKHRRESGRYAMMSYKVIIPLSFNLVMKWSIEMELNWRKFDIDLNMRSCTFAT